jgi:hypothetical protein
VNSVRSSGGLACPDCACRYRCHFGAVGGAPRYLRSDNGPEFVSRALLKWITAQGIETASIDPGKPWQNGSTESFDGKFRGECLSLEWFRSRAEAKVVIETWRRHFNEVRLTCADVRHEARLMDEQIVSRAGFSYPTRDSEYFGRAPHYLPPRAQDITGFLNSRGGSMTQSGQIRISIGTRGTTSALDGPRPSISDPAGPCLRMSA